MTKKLTAATKKAGKRTDADILELPDGAWGFGGPVLDVRCEGKDRRWSCKVIFKGNRITVQLGTIAELPTISAAQQAMARARADAGRDIDPREKIRATRDTVPTFAEAAKRFMDDYVPTLKNAKHQDKYRSSVENHCKEIWNIQADRITAEDVIRTLKPIWKTIPVMANEVRGRIEVILDDVIFRGERTGDNPARWCLPMQRRLGGKPPKSGATRGAHKHVPIAEMPALMAELRDKDRQSARALYCIALSCLRTQEFCQMHTRELDLDAAQPTWTVPKERFKVDPHNKDFVVPLAAQFVRALRDQLEYLAAINGVVRYEGYVWPAVTEDSSCAWISDATMLRYLQRTMGQDATVHGFRASYKTWARGQFLEGTEATPKYHHYAIEYCQAHTTPDNRGSSEDPYSRDQMMYPARVVIMRDWANFCDPRAQAQLQLVA